MSGKPGEKDSRAKLVYKMKGLDIKMIETVLKNNLLNEIHMSYDAKGVYSVQKNYFEAIDDNHTQWIFYSEFEFSGFMKIPGSLLP